MATGVKTRRGCWVIGIVAIAFVLFVAYSIWALLPKSKYGRVPGVSRQIEPQKFMIVVFPTNPGKVRRGVLVSLQDFESQSIQVVVDGRVESMDATAFSLLPPESEEKALIDELNREIWRSRKDTFWRRLNYSINRRGNDNEAIVKIVLHDNREHAMEYNYRVTAAGGVVPVSQLSF